MMIHAAPSIFPANRERKDKRQGIRPPGRQRADMQGEDLFPAHSRRSAHRHEKAAAKSMEKDSGKSMHSGFLAAVKTNCIQMKIQTVADYYCYHCYLMRNRKMTDSDTGRPAGFHDLKSPGRGQKQRNK
jgi:hypothetical protein